MLFNFQSKALHIALHGKMLYIYSFQHGISVCEWWKFIVEIKSLILLSWERLRWMFDTVNFTSSISRMPMLSKDMISTLEWLKDYWVLFIRIVEPLNVTNMDNWQFDTSVQLVLLLSLPSWKMYNLQQGGIVARQSGEALGEPLPLPPWLSFFLNTFDHKDRIYQLYIIHWCVWCGVAVVCAFVYVFKLGTLTIDGQWGGGEVPSFILCNNNNNNNNYTFILRSFHTINDQKCITKTKL